MSAWHTVEEHLLSRRVNVILVGAGGNGSQMLTRLARMDRALRDLGHPGGFGVLTYDPDRVSPANVGRQLFSPSDIGASKAGVLIQRLNAYYGLDWGAFPEAYPNPDADPLRTTPDLLISCVDTAKARREIHRDLCRSYGGRPYYWLDLGNRQADGQVVLGQPGAYPKSPDQDRRGQDRLPTVMEVFPELLDESFEEEDKPSCSLAEALQTQDLFVNDFMVTYAIGLLWRLFRHGRIKSHGYLINLEEELATPIPVPGRGG